MQALSPSNESSRLEALRQHEILDTAPEQQFDDLTHLAAQICGTPISAITLVDQERQWFKSRVGLEVSETPRDVSFCAHAILEPDLLIVPDTLKDERFAVNPLVIDGPQLRFYAGVSLVTPEGQAVGTLCVIDTVPRQLNETQQDALRRLARQAMVLLEARPDSRTPHGQSRQARQRSDRRERTVAAESARQVADRILFSEERYRRLFEAAKDGILILDAATGRIEDVNPYLCQLLDYAPSDFLGKQLWQIGTFRDIAANQEAFHALQEKEHIRYSDLPLETSGGGTAAVEFISNVYVSGDKKVIQCNIRDITERKRAAAQLIESRQRLGLATASARMGIWEWDVVENKLVWDEQMYALYGIRAQDFGGAYEAWRNGVHPEDRVDDAAVDIVLRDQQEFHTQFRVVWPTGEVRHIEAHALVQRADDGSVLRMTGVNWDITEREEVKAALLRLRDELEERVEERTLELAQANAALQTQISEREEAEAEIRTRARQQEVVAELGRQALTNVDMDTLLNGATALVSATLNVELATVLELMPDGGSFRIRAGTGWKKDIVGHQVPGDPSSKAAYPLASNAPTIVLDLRTETRFVPPPLLLEQGIISGITVAVGSYEQPYGTLGAHTVHHRRFTQDDVHFLQSMSNVLATAHEQRRIETEMRQLNEQLKRTNEQLRVENIERQMAMGALREVTQVLEQAKEEADVARENAEVANRAKSEFLSRMSHELRTPLNAILGFSQLLEKQDLSPLAKEGIGYILKGGRHLLDLINEVLDIARVEAGRIDLSLEPIALNEVVPEACALVRPLAAERGIRLAENSADLWRSHIMADRQRFKQALINLLANAIKYNHEGGQAEVFCEHTPNGWTSIAVRDTGPGISPQDLPKLFTPFERLNASATEVEGTGLGLVLSQRLVTAMGGTISVQSTLGQGTTFTIALPQAAAPEEKVSNLPGATPVSGANADVEPLYSVLCIEDNPSNLRLMEAIFDSRPEINLLTAIQGSIGLDMARRHEPDLILLDLNLPDIHGREVLARLQQSALTKSIPVVVVSADATPNQIEKLLAAGARDYLTKPLNVSQFLNTLEQFLPVAPAVAGLNSSEEVE